MHHHGHMDFLTKLSLCTLLVNTTFPKAYYCTVINLITQASDCFILITIKVSPPPPPPPQKIKIKQTRKQTRKWKTTKETEYRYITLSLRRKITFTESYFVLGLIE